MIRFKILFLFLAAGFMFSCGASKQTAQAEPTVQERQGPRRPGQGGQFNDDMAAQLELTADQKVEFDAVNQKYRQKMQQMRQQSQGDREGMRASFTTMREEQTAEIKKILSPEQFEKYTKIQEERRARRGGGQRG